MPVSGQAYGEDTMSDLQRKLPCRSQQIHTLLSLFGKAGQPACPSMFIYGHTCTGKSLVISTILNSLKFPHVVVNCVECYTQRLVYEHILTTLFPALVLPRTDNMNDFIRHLKQNIQETDMAMETLYIVLDKAERLRDMYVNLLPAFLRLQELTGANICTIFLSEIVWEKFRFGTGFSEPIIVHFPDYSKDDLIEIISQDCPSEDQDELYRSYVSLVLDIFYLACRELRELRHLALLNFPKYIEPIEKGEATAQSTKKLWRNIEPHLKKALQTVYLREISSTQWERLQQAEEGQATNVQALSSRTHIELPYYTKFLLIAAYLASYNPAKTDKRFFAKHSGKTSRRDKLIKKHERTTNQMLGPKPFPLDRLMAIFYSIVEERVAPTANIFMQVSSLVTLHLVSAVVGDDQLDSPKYKCLVSLDFIKAVSRTVSFDIVRYLYDFI